MAKLSRNDDGTYTLVVTHDELEQIERAQPLVYEGMPGRTRRAAERNEMTWLGRAGESRWPELRGLTTDDLNAHARDA